MNEPIMNNPHSLQTHGNLPPPPISWPSSWEVGVLRIPWALGLTWSFHPFPFPSHLHPVLSTEPCSPQCTYLFLQCTTPP